MVYALHILKAATEVLKVNCQYRVLDVIEDGKERRGRPMRRQKKTTALVKKECSPVRTGYRMSGTEFNDAFFDDVFGFEPYSGLHFPALRFPDIGFTGFEQSLTPEIKVREEKGKVVVKAEMPGYKPEDIKVTLHNNILSVSGCRCERKNGRGSVETSSSSFESSVTLPGHITPGRMIKHYRNGELTVEVPRKEIRKLLKAA